ncbi:YjbQ family protein [Sulfolobus sp. E5-1-F]|uniref:secondary thiamine-phosphate synthase enzyme YjbQ n=1 Tax=Sulfolobaceae TaxID=118883 RepID=UPI0012975478|nr:MULTISPECIES: secondary thiamine-phosphate synthase enzyme YjbQ [unclassified Sulfolobus]QGA53680.1 YjbQ family protein [Sulfolobus sp. E5-1-F]QGA68666.1 YjbQ family protein [Sulfolobus sp. E11-6]
MKVYFEDIQVSTTRQFELIDITDQVEEIVEKSGVKNGICLIFVAHSTAAIVANEHERGLMEDILTKIKEFTEPSRGWKHNLIDDNAHAHLGATFLGAERVFPVRDGKLIRGTWQNIFLVELDGPRSERRITVEILGE